MTHKLLPVPTVKKNPLYDCLSPHKKRFNLHQTRNDSPLRNNACVSSSWHFWIRHSFLWYVGMQRTLNAFGHIAITALELPSKYNHLHNPLVGGKKYTAVDTPRRFYYYFFFLSVLSLEFMILTTAYFFFFFFLFLRLRTHTHTHTCITLPYDIKKIVRHCAELAIKRPKYRHYNRVGLQWTVVRYGFGISVQVVNT